MSLYFRILFLLLLLGGNKLRLNAQCSARFSHDTVSCSGQNVVFTPNSQVSGNQYDWNFGDISSGTANFDTSAVTSHTFAKSGYFTITLIITRGSTCRDSVSQKIRIFKTPQADFTYQNACQDLPSVFNSSGTQDTNDRIKRYSWNLGNSSTASGISTTVNYTAAQNYTVKLVVESNFGCKDSISKTITVYDKPSATVSAKEICQNNTIKFTAAVRTSALSYTYDFGDSSTFTQRVVDHVYLKSGWMKPSLRVNYPNTSCLVALDSIKVNPNPDARFTILDSIQCFNNNRVCIKLQHDKGVSKRTVTFDDGYVDQSSFPQDTVVCHSYIDPDGGVYKITVELTDTNGCSSTEFLDSGVIIHRRLQARIANNPVQGCFGVDVRFTNLSNRDSSELKKVIWIWGDTTNSDTLPFRFGSHRYEKDGVFYGRLVIQDKDGCWDTADATNSIRNTSYPVDAQIDTLLGYCYNKNELQFSQTPINGAQIEWQFPSIRNAFSGLLSYNYPGVYVPQVKISKNGCDSSLIFDSVVIYGPVARITNVVNQFQCQITDTVYLDNGSYAFRNKNLSVYWDAQDPFGPKCVAPGKNQQNSRKNCNYSTDSFSFQHLYQKGKEDCYFAKLVVTDTALGCSDSTLVALPLMAPKAKGNFTPSDTFACPGANLASQNKTLTFDLSKPEPSCLKYAWWVMWDSLQASKTNNFDSLWVANSIGHNYDALNSAGDSSGYVTVGLIVENGYDSSGVLCRDTAWFSKIIKVTRIDARFLTNYNDSTHFCRGDTLHFALQDTQQNKGIRFIWNFGDGTSIDTVSQKPLWHRYKNGGSYYVSLIAIHPDGCRMEEGTWVHIGVMPHFTISKSSLCVGVDSLDLFQQNRYFTWGDSKSRFFNSNARNQQGKEKVQFDLNEGDGYKYYGENPRVAFKAPGIHRISMIVSDSTGCEDTLVYYQQVSISGAYAGFSTATDTFLCPQSIAFTNTATTYDSALNKTLAGDYISSYEYTFGSNYPKSLFPNPSRFFETGSYRVVQKVRNAYGCTDTFVKNIIVKGPTAFYDFLKDTVGCSPLRVVFKNRSTDANEYTWRFNDINNNVFTTSSDSNVFLNYGGYGTFYPLLVARGSFTVNGVTRVCQSMYPDTSTQIKREVRVLERPNANVVWSTDCRTFTSTFYNVSTMNTGTIDYFWASFGDGADLGNGFNPNLQIASISRKYADTGTYNLFARVVGSNGCADTFESKVKISPPPIANFRWDPNCIGEATRFYDSSRTFNDYITSYLWDLNDGSYSSQRNPTRLYNSDRSYNVRLRVRNSAGCVKDTSKTVVVYSRPNVSFFGREVCHEDTTEMVNLSSAKQEIAYYDWDFADGDTSQAWAPRHRYATPNAYQVKLRVKTVHGCWDSSIRWVFVDPNPVAGLKLNGDSVQCFTQHAFNFEDISTISSGNTTAQWDFGDGGTSFIKSNQKRYSDTGRYQVKLISVSNYGCRDTQFTHVRVLPSVVTDFDIDKSIQCFRGNQFAFTDKSVKKGGSYDYLWEFGDGDTVRNVSPIQHRYQDTGLIFVLMRTLTNLGCADTAIKPIRLLPMPKADFTINEDDQCLSTNYFSYTNTASIFWGSLTHSWDLGNGSVLGNLNAGLTYADTGIKTVTLISRSAAGCADTVSYNVWVREMPIPSFTINDSSQCQNQNSFDFKSTSTVAVGRLDYQWRLGDGTTQTADAFNYRYKGDQEPIVVLTATSVHGCEDSVKRQVFVRPMPQVRIWVNDSQQCVNQQAFVFRDTSRIRYGSFSSQWRYKGDSLAQGNQLQVNFPRDTFYRVRLVAVSNYGCKDSVEQRIQAWPKPFPNFDIADDGICLRGNEFNFSQTGTIKFGTLQHKWRFGDGSVAANGVTSKHSYGTDGTFTVQLRSESNNFCVDSVSKPVYVWPMPKANFSMNDSTQCYRGNAVQFTSSATLTRGTLRYYWNFGDAVRDSGMAVSHTYAVHNKYRPAHWVITDKACGDTLVKEVYIYPMPVADFVINDTGQCLNQQSFNFNDISRIASGSMRRKWTFFDSSSALTTITRTFPADIRYSVRLTQESNFGCLDTQLRHITVYPKPQVAFLLNDSDQCLKQNFYKFTNASTIKYGTLSHRWNIGEFGETYTSVNSDYFYSFWGVKRPLLTVTSDLGCVDSLRRLIKVNPMPVPAIGHNDSSQCFNNQNFIFWSKSRIAEGNLSHRWLMGDAQVRTEDSFTHYYAKDTFYTIKLIETSGVGCVDSVTAFAVARPSPEIEFRINDTLQCLRQNRFEITNYTRIKYGTTVGSWLLGDGTLSSVFEPVHVYKTHGTYLISLRAISNHGCADTVTKTVIVGAMPVMNYIVNDYGQCFLTHEFALLNLSNIASGTYQGFWHFGDDTVRISNNDQLYKYAKVGDYPVKLIGLSNYGCMDSVTKILSVNPNPRVFIAINDSDQCINAQNFRFTAQSLIERGRIRRYDWSLGENDLNTYNTQSVQKVYQQSGFKTIRLVNVSDSGCVDSAKRVIRVYPKPDARIAVNDSAQCLYQNRYVFNDESIDSLGLKRRWWDINKELAVGSNPVTHVFGTPGMKAISLIVESEWSCMDTAQRSVFVKPMPDPRFQALREFYCENTGNYPLTALTNGGRFYGKNVQNGFEYVPVNLWRDTVTYVVTVEGCTDSSKQFTQVYPQPFVDLGNDTTVCKNEILELQLRSWNSKYQWDNGSSRAERRIVEAGLYWVTATNLCGSISDSVRIAYRDFNCRIHIPNAFTPSGDGLNETFAPVAFDLDELEYQIYNRWGEKIYEGVLNGPGWDGTYLGSMAPQGAYIINVRYRYRTGNRGILGNDKLVFYLLR